MKRSLKLMIAGTLWLGAECPASAQPAYFSLTGNFVTGGDQHDFFFDLTRPVGSDEVLRFETFANGGGTNAAGETIPAGGIDSVLELFDSAATQRGKDDDGSFTAGTDSLLSWPGVGEFNSPPNHVPLNPDPLPADSYRLNLSEFGNNDPGPWALDLVGPADAITLTGDSPTGTSAISTLTAGNGAQVNFAGPYELNGGKSFTFQSGAEFTVTSYLDIGNTTNGWLLLTDPGTTLTTNTASSTFIDWGRDGGFANILISNGATATINATRIDMAADADPNSFGQLIVDQGANMTANSINVGTGSSILSSAIGVEDIGSSITQNGAATLSIGGPTAGTFSGILAIRKSGVFNAGSGGITVNPGGDIAISEGGTLNTSGSVTVASLGHPGGGGGTAGVQLTTEGQIASGNVTVATNSAHGSVLINGFVPGIGLRATWQVNGLMTIGSAGLGSGSVTVEQAGRLNTVGDLNVTGSMDATGTLTVRTNGEVTVGDHLTIGNFGTVNVLGSQITARSFIVNPSGTFTHTDGTLTVDGGQFTIQLGTHTIDSGGGTGLPTLRLVNGAQGSVENNPGITPPFQEGVLYVGRDGRGRMEILGGSRMVSGAGRIADGIALPSSGEGFVLVQGAGSIWELNVYAGVRDLWVGRNGAGTLEIRDGGQVVVHASDVEIGSPWNANYAGQGGPGIGIVDGAGSLLRVERVSSDGGSLAIGALDPVTGASGSLTVSNGGRVEADESIRVVDAGTVLLTSDGEIYGRSFIVKEAGGTFEHEDGTLTVDGGTFDLATSAYSISGAAAGDEPTVRLINGATASFDHARIGETGNAVVEVIGPGSRLSIADAAFVGYDAVARLEIRNGGSVQHTGTFFDVGVSTGSGEVIVQDAGSSLSVRSQMRIGDLVSGTLTVSNGGVAEVVAGDAAIAGYTGPGLVTVTGDDSQWIVSNDLHVGERGQGSLTIDGGASVSTGGNAFLGSTFWGNDTAGNGRATVSGTGSAGIADPSRWTITGSLFVGGDAVQSVGSGLITVANDGQVTAGSVKVWQPGTIELDSGIISTGTLELAGGGTLQGNGTVLVSGALANGGVVSPGVSPGVITVSGGNYEQATSGTLAIEIGGRFASQYDRLDIVSGAATLAGTLNVSLIDLGGGVFAPSAGDTFEVLTAAGGISGRFTSELLPTLGGNLVLDVIYGANTVSLVAALAGDYNFDGAVNAADYVLWRKNDGSQAGYDTWRANFGATAGSGAAGDSPSHAAVPEPAAASAVLLLATVMAGVLVCRRGRRR